MRRRARHDDDDEEFVEAFVQLYPQAVRLARRLLADTAAAEDVAAEALARTYARWRKVRDLPYRDAWVLRVVTNLTLDTLARRTVGSGSLPTDAPTGAVDLRLALADALRRLPKRQREVIVLRHLAGYREQEVATALGIGPGTVKTHTKRALAAMRADLGADFVEVADV